MKVAYGKVHNWVKQKRNFEERMTENEKEKKRSEAYDFKSDTSEYH